MTNSLTLTLDGVLPATAPAALDRVLAVEERVLQAPQVDISTHHVLHAGMYVRTIMIPEGTVLTGALVKVPTVLGLAGDVTVLVGDSEVRISGYRVIPAAAGRKQAFIAHADTWITMAFRTNARSVEEAEQEFTDDHARLMSRQGHNEIVIGELP